MKALVFKRYGGLDQIAFTDIPRPVLKPGEILVQVHAAGLNPVDNKIREGKLKAIRQYQLPTTLGSDIAGIVVEVGRGVTRFKAGDAVFGSIEEMRMGALAEFAVVAENAAALKPAHLDFEQAASVPMVGLTAWQALKEHARLKAGQKVFIPAGSGASAQWQSNSQNISDSKWGQPRARATSNSCAASERMRWLITSSGQVTSAVGQARE
jgi:NADPH:quinone reductase-like Zn-dependent oxidoreductase